MPRPGLNDFRGLPDYQTVFRWNLIFDKFPNAFATLGFAFTPAEVNLRCETTEVPKKTIQPIDMDMRGHRRRISGILIPAGSLTITFQETVDHKVRDLINAWKLASWGPGNNAGGNRAGRAFNDTDLRATFRLEQLDNSDNVVYQYKIIDAGYEDADLGTLDGVTSDIQKPSLTVYYSDFDEGVTV